MTWGTDAAMEEPTICMHCLGGQILRQQQQATNVSSFCGGLWFMCAVSRNFNELEKDFTLALRLSQTSMLGLNFHIGFKANANVQRKCIK